jgi:hypothetical protein
MSKVIETLLCLVAYAGGLVIISTATPRILKHNFDEGLFMGIAAAAIAGGLLAFAPIGILFSIYNGTTPVRVINFVMLAAILGISLRIAIRSFRPTYMTNVVRVSGILAGSYCVLLVLAALYAIIQMIVLP